MSTRDTLDALGASLLAAGLLARLGRSIGLPTIPLFMIAGLLRPPSLVVAETAVAPRVRKLVLPLATPSPPCSSSPSG